MTVTGFTLGERFTVKECDKNSFSLGPDRPTCFIAQNRYHHPPELGRHDWKVVTVHLSPGASPSIFKSGSLQAYVKDEVLVAVAFQTDGWQSQQRTLKSLVQKYGAPSKQWTEKMQSGTGGRFGAIVASWKLKGLLIDFHGITTDMETGDVIVGVPAGVDLVNADSKRISGGSSPKL